MAELKRRAGASTLGMHTEQLAGRTQQVFFSAEEEENFLYPDAFDVDFNKRTEFDAAALDTRAINLQDPRADGSRATARSWSTTRAPSTRWASASSIDCSSTSRAASAISAAA